MYVTYPWEWGRVYPVGIFEKEENTGKTIKINGLDKYRFGKF